MKGGRSSRTAMIVLCILIFFVVSVQAQKYSVESVELILYRDGVVHVTHTLTVNETYSEIAVMLLTSSIENVVVVDENGTILSCDTRDAYMTIFTLGAERALIEYDTGALTRMEAGVWTLSLNALYNLTAHFPEGATIIYLSNAPDSINVKDNTTILKLFPGIWEISYVLPIVLTTPIPTPTPTPSPSPTATPIPTPTPSEPLLRLEHVAFIGILAVAAVLIVAIISRRRESPIASDIIKKYPDLRSDERDVIGFIAESGGRVLESEIRERFDLPRTSVWRMAKRLEAMGIVVIRKVGVQNQIELRR